jgi:NAD kinase
MIGIAAKHSKLEWDMLGTGMSKDELCKQYSEKGQDVKRILSSHDRQIRSIESILDAVGDVEIIDMINIDDAEKVPELDTIISIGGDNFFQKCAFYFPDAYFVGVNSDTQTSHGALLNFDYISLQKNISDIVKGNFEAEYWTKTATTLNGNRLEDTTCTLALTIKTTDMMSRYLLRLNDEQEEQKATGILVATGAGAGKGAWYRNAGLYLPQVKSGLYPTITSAFPKEARMLRTITREPMGGEDCEYRWLNHTVMDEEELRLVYWTHDPSELSIDSIERYDVNEGDVLAFKISDNKLKVIENPNV